MKAHHLIATCLVAATVAACGSSDSGPVLDTSLSADPTTTPSTAGATTDTGAQATAPPSTSAAATTTEPAAAPVEGPVSTLSPDIPEQFLAGIAPVDVIGDALPAFPKSGDDPAIGLPAPTLVGFDSHGEPIRFDPSTEGPAMLVFLAHWCPHCNAEVPRLNQLRDEGRFPAELDIVAVLTGSRPDYPNWPPTDWLNDTMDWTYGSIVDGIDLERQSFIAYDAYGVGGFPFVTLIDADGNVALRWDGEREPDEVMSLIGSALGL